MTEIIMTLIMIVENIKFILNEESRWNCFFEKAIILKKIFFCFLPFLQCVNVLL